MFQIKFTTKYHRFDALCDLKNDQIYSKMQLFWPLSIAKCIKTVQGCHLQGALLSILENNGNNEHLFGDEYFHWKWFTYVW